MSKEDFYSFPQPAMPKAPSMYVPAPKAPGYDEDRTRARTFGSQPDEYERSEYSDERSRGRSRSNDDDAYVSPRQRGRQSYGQREDENAERSYDRYSGRNEDEAPEQTDDRPGYSGDDDYVPRSRRSRHDTSDSRAPGKDTTYDDYDYSNRDGGNKKGLMIGLIAVIVLLLGGFAFAFFSGIVSLGGGSAKPVIINTANLASTLGIQPAAVLDEKITTASIVEGETIAIVLPQNPNDDGTPTVQINPNCEETYNNFVAADPADSASPGYHLFGIKLNGVGTHTLAAVLYDKNNKPTATYEYQIVTSAAAPDIIEPVATYDPPVISAQLVEEVTGITPDALLTVDEKTCEVEPGSRVAIAVNEPMIEGYTYTISPAPTSVNERPVDIDAPEGETPIKIFMYDVKEAIEITYEGAIAESTGDDAPIDVHTFSITLTPQPASKTRGLPTLTPAIIRNLTGAQPTIIVTDPAQKATARVGDVIAFVTPANRPAGITVTTSSVSASLTATGNGQAYIAPTTDSGGVAIVCYRATKEEVATVTLQQRDRTAVIADYAYSITIDKTPPKLNTAIPTLTPEDAALIIGESVTNVTNQTKTAVSAKAGDAFVVQIPEDLASGIFVTDTINNNSPIHVLYSAHVPSTDNAAGYRLYAFKALKAGKATVTFTATDSKRARLGNYKIDFNIGSPNPGFKTIALTELKIGNETVKGILQPGQQNVSKIGRNAKLGIVFPLDLVGGQSAVISSIPDGMTILANTSLIGIDSAASYAYIVSFTKSGLARIMVDVLDSNGRIVSQIPFAVTVS